MFCKTVKGLFKEKHINVVQQKKLEDCQIWQNYKLATSWKLNKPGISQQRYFNKIPKFSLNLLGIL